LLIYINGEFYPREKALVSVFDHGYLYGDGIYETLRTYGGRVFKLEEHAERLSRSAGKIFLGLPFDEAGMAVAVQDTLKNNGLDVPDKDAYIRVTVSRGPGELGLDPGLCPKPTVVIIAKEFKGYPPEMYEEGIKVSIAGTRRNPPSSLDPAIKSTNFLNNILAKVEAGNAGAYEAIMLNQDGYVAEGTISNVFMVSGGILLTPPEDAGILMGVTRGFIIGIAKRLGIPVKEELITPESLSAADEVFITNTTMEVMPVTTIDGGKVGTGRVGDMVKRLRNAYMEEVTLCLKTQ
jgi:branched-chain amino acid aminotransferase